MMVGTTAEGMATPRHMFSLPGSMRTYSRNAEQASGEGREVPGQTPCWRSLPARW
jgi:hypothetical protein